MTKKIILIFCSINFFFLFCQTAWVHRLTGEPFLYSKGELTKKIRIKPKMALYEKDLIKTDGRSTVVIAFKTSSLVHVSQHSTVSIKKLNYKKKSDRSDFVLQIPIKGKLISFISKLTKKRKFQFFTPTAIAGVRGTKLVVDVPDPETSIVAVFKGKVIVKDFVTEQGLSTDPNEMMLDMLQEVDLDTQSIFTYKKSDKKGKKEPLKSRYKLERRIANDLEKNSELILELLSEDENKQDGKESLEEESSRLREEAESSK